MQTVNLTIREQKLRYAKPWLAIAYFSIPTVLIMLIQGLYKILLIKDWRFNLRRLIYDKILGIFTNII